MAPQCPEEVDVFTVPHSRMKELVCKYLDMLTATNFSNVGHVTYLLESLIKTFQEFIAHEQIENQFIMKRLKNKLRSLSIQNTAVCNCHKDNRLTDMLKFLQDGYKRTKKTDVDHFNYGIQLRQELEDFTETFLPHMAEEEEVFQPLLMQHFTVDELKQLKATVIQQHFKMEPNETPEKFVADNETSESHVSSVSRDVSDESQVNVGSLPDEILTKVFSYLNPQELCRSAQVSRRWNQLTFDGSLWNELYPVSWAKGLWNATCGVYEEDSIDVNEKLDSKAYDEDADIDETDDWDEEALQIQSQSRKLTSMCKHLLPLVGRHIKHCDLAYSKGLTNGTLYKILSLCPNLEYLDVTQTRVSDLGFKGFKKSCGQKLKHLDLSGCLYMTDLTLQRLSSALGQVPCHMTENDEEPKGHVTKQDQVTKPDPVTKQDMVNTAKETEYEDRCRKCEANRQTESYGTWNMSQVARHCQNMMGKPNCCFMVSNGKCAMMKSAREEKCCEYKNSSCCSASHDVDLGADCFCKQGCDMVGRCQSVCWERSDSNNGQNDTQSGCHGCAGTHGNDDNDVERTGELYEDNCKNPLNKTDEKNEDFASQDRSWKKQELYVGKKCEADHTVQDKNQQSLVNEQSGVNTVISNDCIGTSVKTEIIQSSLQLSGGPNTRLESSLQLSDEPNTRLESSLQLSDEPNTRLESSLQLSEGPDIQLGCSLQLIEGPNTRLESSLHVGEVLNTQLEELQIAGTEPDIPVSGNGRYITVDRDNLQLNVRPLEFLSLSGCHKITDVGLDYLTSTGGLPKLKHLDLSGCLNVDGDAVSALVSTAPSLDPVNLFYCDNIVDGPYADTASGCQNLQCTSRVCCRCGE